MPGDNSSTPPGVDPQPTRGSLVDVVPPDRQSSAGALMATPTAESMLEAAATVMETCALDGCTELSTRHLNLSHRGKPVSFPVCREHHHDIDWGCIRRNRWLRSAVTLPPPPG